MRKIDLFDFFIILTMAVAIFLLIVAIAPTINDYMSSYEYETIDGEKGTATYCINPYRGIPYCILDDGTKLYGIKQYKKVQKEEE